MRRMLVTLALGGIASGATIAACSSTPFGSTGDGEDSGAAEGGGMDGSTDAPRDAFVPFDTGSADVQVVSDAGMRVDASGCTVCDCDGDGFNDTTKAGCQDAGGANDCDDTDTRSRPNQGFLQIPSEPPRNGDWNCSGIVERAFRADTKCADLPASACDGVFGFEDSPPCAAAGKYVECKVITTPPLNLDPHCGVALQKINVIQACK